jgi:hypothetical protein
MLCGLSSKSKLSACAKVDTWSKPVTALDKAEASIGEYFAKVNLEAACAIFQNLRCES